jgi:plasmid stability protein
MNVLIRGLDEKTVEALKKRAKESKRSLQAELKATLEESVAKDWRRTWDAADPDLRRVAPQR